MPIDWAQVASAVLSGILPIIGGLIVKHLAKLVASIQELNIKVAEIVALVGGHEKTLEDHSTRITRLEDGQMENRNG